MSGREFDREAYKGIHGAASEMKERGARFISVMARDNGDGTVELIYLFDLEGRMEDRRYVVLPEWEVDTVSDLYPGATNMERENVDLLGLRFKGILPGLLLVAGKSKVAPLRKPPAGAGEVAEDD